MRILVVDDCRDAADSLSLLFRYCGHEAKAVYDGEAALHEVTGFHPDLVFVDLAMPRIDGFKLVKQIGSVRDPINCVVVAYTGYPSYRQQALQAGFFDYLLKPASLEQLREAVDRAKIHLNEKKNGDGHGRASGESSQSFGALMDHQIANEAPCSAHGAWAVTRPLPADGRA